MLFSNVCDVVSAKQHSWTCDTWQCNPGCQSTVQLLQVEEVNGVEAGLMQDAQRFFVLTQTDNLWKEHLQAIKFVQQVSIPVCNFLWFAVIQSKCPQLLVCNCLSTGYHICTLHLHALLLHY